MIRERIENAKKLDPNFPWHHRGYLPHFDGQDHLQFVTFRLAGSIPRNTLQKLKLQRTRKQISDIDYHREVERLLDEGYGPAFLAERDVASIVSENLIRFDGERYQLLHWVIMPTHVHILLRRLGEHSLASIIHSVKSFTANRANTLLNRSGSFWNAEYYDRYIRDEEHYQNTVHYIHRNPVKARLCASADEWPFGCARHHGC